MGNIQLDSASLMDAVSVFGEIKSKKLSGVGSVPTLTQSFGPGLYMLFISQRSNEKNHDFARVFSDSNLGYNFSFTATCGDLFLITPIAIVNERGYSLSYLLRAGSGCSVKWSSTERQTNMSLTKHLLWFVVNTTTFNTMKTFYSVYEELKKKI